MEKFDIKSFDGLFSAVLKLKTNEDCQKFFEDVCTIKELQDMTQRVTVAKYLSEGKSYQEISKETGASPATISRVSKCLNYGDGGYENVLKAIKEDEK